MDSILDQQRRAERTEGPPSLELNGPEKFMCIVAILAALVAVWCLVAIYGAR